MVKSSAVNPPGTGARSGIGLMIAVWPASARIARAGAAAVGRVGKHLDVPGLGGEQVDPDGRVAAVSAGGFRQCAGGRQAGLGLDREVRLEPVLAAVHRLVGVPGFGVHDADDPVRGDLAGDPPPRRPAGSSGVGVDQLDVLTGDQREQPDRVGRRPAARLLGPATRPGPRGRRGPARRSAPPGPRSSFQAILGLPGSS